MDFQPMHAGRKTIPKIASERLLIKGGKVVNHDLTFRADVFIENGIIRQLGTDLTIPGGVTTIDARGAVVLPGGVDLSTNFDSQLWFEDEAASNAKTVDNFYSGTRAALLGGTTTVVDFASGDKGRLLSTFKERSEAGSTSCCDVSFHVDVTSWNDDVKKAMTTLATNNGVNSFRVSMSDRWQLNDEQLYEVLEHVKSLGCIALVRAENGSIVRKKVQALKEKDITQPEALLKARDEDVEWEAVNRIIIIAKQVSCPIFFCSVTGKRALEAISQARNSGQPVYAQALAIALVQSGSSYRQSSWNKSLSCVTWPPLRDDPEAEKNLLQCLTNGTLQCVSSGHSVFTNTTKTKLGKSDFSKIPPGTNGAYERMMALWSAAVCKGYIDQNQFVAVSSTNAAKIFNLFPRKGHVAVGSDADLVIWRENEHRSLAEAAATLNVTKADCSNAFEEVESNAGPSVVICHGKVVFDDNQVNVIQSLGKMLERPTFAPFIYNRLKVRDANAVELRPIREQGSDTPTSSLNVNGSPASDEKLRTNEKPERYTRNSGIRPMHQSGWSFSGDQVGDTDKKKQNRYSTPPGGLSHISLN